MPELTQNPSLPTEQVAPASTPSPNPSAYKLDGVMPSHMADKVFSFDDEGSTPDPASADKPSPTAAEPSGDKPQEVKVEEAAKPKVPANELGKLKPTDLPQPAPKVEAVAENKPAAPAIPTGKRDYSQFEPELVEALKSTPNKAYVVVERHLRELKAKAEETGKKLETLQTQGFPDSWLEHPNAWALHPAVSQHNIEMEDAQRKAGFYKQQIINIGEGRDFQIIKKNAEGKEYLSDPITGSKEAEEALREEMNKMSSLANQRRAELTNFQQSFGKRVEEVNGYVQKIVDEQWPWTKKDDAPEWDTVKEFMAAVPRELHNQQGVKVSAYLYVTNMKLQKRIQELEKEKNVQGTVAQQKSLMEPSVISGVDNSQGEGAAIASKFGGKYKPPAVFTIDD